MKLWRIVTVLVVLAIVATLGMPAMAGKKKKPKPFTSEDGIIAVPHTLLYATSGEVNSVTANEFENLCQIPATNGLDAYVWEVPAEYQTIESTIESASTADAYNLYIFFYKEDCTLQSYSLQATSATELIQQAPKGLMPAGTHYVLMANFLGDPAATINFTLTP